MEKIIIYYVFTPLTDPEAMRLWQRTLCERHNLLGRIIISPHGINATVGGDVESLKAYVRETRGYESFRKIDVKWNNGKRSDFPRLSVKVRPELVAFGAGEELKVDSQGVVGGGKHLKPKQVHELIAEHNGDVVFFDGRNAYEAAVGKFKDAVTPDVKTSKDFLAELASDKYDAIKDKPVVTYCTGGIRCEIISSLMKNRGFKDVYQIDGGILRYGEAYGDKGLWEGSLYVFDNRMGTKFSEQAPDIGHCARCDTPTSQYQNCANLACHELILLCEACSPHAVCSVACQEIVATSAAN